MSVSTEWWSTFFSGLAVESWARFENAECTRAEADFIEKSLSLRAGASVLDVPCGNGRHSLELSSRGHRLTGVDIAPANIESAARRAAERGLEASFERRDMRDLPWTAAFDGVYCFGNSYPYLDDGGNAEFLRSVQRALRPGGRFVLETGYVIESLFPNFEKRAWYEIGGLFFLADRRHDARRGRLEVDYTFIDGARIERKSCSVRTYSCLEVVRLFEGAGLEVTDCLGSLDGEPYRTGAQCLYVLAAKP